MPGAWLSLVTAQHPCVRFESSRATRVAGAPSSQDSGGREKHLSREMPAPAGGNAMTSVAERPKPSFYRSIARAAALHQLVHERPASRWVPRSTR